MEQLKICYEYWDGSLYLCDSGPRPRVTGVSLKKWFNVFVGVMDRAFCNNSFRRKIDNDSYYYEYAIYFEERKFIVIYEGMKYYLDLDEEIIDNYEKGEYNAITLELKKLLDKFNWIIKKDKIIDEAKKGIFKDDESKRILQGEFHINDDWRIQYGMNGYLDEGFLGKRISGKLAEVIYEKNYNVSDLGIRFRNRLSAGIAEDFRRDFSTSRVRWLGQAQKPIWYYGDDINNRYAVFEMSTQGGATVYGTGDVFALLRFGPRLRTETDRWIQTLGYYYTATHGQSAFRFDRYRYGTNNFYLSEGLKVNKYLSLMWSGSFALNRDAWDNKLMQENRFFVMVGPEDVKFTLGYDTIRERTLFNCFFILGTKNADLEFKKLYIKNPDKLGKEEGKPIKPEKAKLEAKATIKPSLKDRFFKKSKPIEVEPEVEEQMLIEEEDMIPIMHTLEGPEIISPEVKDKNEVPSEEGVNTRKWNSGPLQLYDETTSPILTPMTTPLQMMGY